MSIRRDTMLNVVGAVVPILVMLITVPLYLDLLGEARYGILSLVWLALGYFSFMELGLGKATANQIARNADATGHERGAIFWTALSVNLAMGVVAAGVIGLTGWALLAGSDVVPGGIRPEIQTAFPWLVATFPLVLVSSVLVGALEGRKRFLELNALQIVGSTAFQVLPLVMARLLHGGLDVVLPTAVLVRAGMNVLFLACCWRVLPLVGRPRPSRAYVRPLFTFGAWVAVSNVANTLIVSVERFVLLFVSGAVAVTRYTLPAQIARKLQILPNALMRAVFPAMSAVDAPGSRLLAEAILVRLAEVMSVAVIGTMLVLAPFMAIWVGPDIAAVSSPVGEIILVGIWFAAIGHVPYFLLQAQGRPGVVARFQVAVLAAYVPAVWLAAVYGGLRGVAVVFSLKCVAQLAYLMRRATLSRGVWRSVSLTASAVMLVLVVINLEGEYRLVVRGSLSVLLAAWGSVVLRRLARMRPHRSREADNV